MGHTRNRCVGSLEEAVAAPLDLPFSPDTLRRVIEDELERRSPYTHQQVADRAERFALTRRDDAEGGADLALAVEVAEDIGAQWHLRLVNTFSLSELQRLHLELEAMPAEWFADWAVQLSTV